jgi:hypothetical protein
LGRDSGNGSAGNNNTSSVSHNARPLDFARAIPHFGKSTALVEHMFDTFWRALVFAALIDKTLDEQGTGVVLEELVLPFVHDCVQSAPRLISEGLGEGDAERLDDAMPQSRAPIANLSVEAGGSQECTELVEKRLHRVQQRLVGRLFLAFLALKLA